MGSLEHFEKLLLPPVSSLIILFDHRSVIVVGPDELPALAESQGQSIKVEPGNPEGSFEAVIEITPIDKDRNPLVRIH
jgi:hypothetical protein